MTDSVIITLATKAILHIILMSAPIILTAMIVGFSVSILQAVTQVQEQTLSFVPKSLSVYAMLILIGPWLLKTILQFTQYVFSNIPQFLAGSAG